MEEKRQRLTALAAVMAAMRHLGIGTTTLFINFIPLITAFISAWLFQEISSWGQIWGGCLVIPAVTLVSLQRIRRRGGS